MTKTNNLHILLELCSIIAPYILGSNWLSVNLAGLFLLETKGKLHQQWQKPLLFISSACCRLAVEASCWATWLEPLVLLFVTKSQTDRRRAVECVLCQNLEARYPSNITHLVSQAWRFRDLLAADLQLIVKRVFLPQLLPRRHGTRSHWIKIREGGSRL